MSQKKIPRNQRRKQAAADAEIQAAPTAAEAIKRRRNRRFLFVAVVAITLPILELIAYQYRSIQIVVVNRSDAPVLDVKVSYPGGSFAEPELKSGGEVTHTARPDYSFSRAEFSTYRTVVSIRTPTNGIIRQNARTGTVDYSAQETYSIEPDGPSENLTIKHTTYPGFPLGAIRDLFRWLGLR